MKSHVRSLSFRQLFSIALLLCALLFIASELFAWTGPTQSPPNGNVAAPINVGSISQLKDGTLGVDSLGVFGNMILNGTNGDGTGDGVNTYLNFGPVSGSSGYGFRDNNGTLEYKDTNGTWTPIGGSGSGNGSEGGSGDSSGDNSSGSDSGRVVGGGWCHPNQDQPNYCPNFTLWGDAVLNSAGHAGVQCTQGTYHATGLGASENAGHGYPAGFIFVDGFICVIN